MDTHIISSVKIRLSQDIESGTASILNRRTMGEIIKCFDQLQAENKALKEIISEIEILVDKEIKAMFGGDAIAIPINIQVSAKTIVKIKALQEKPK